MERSRKRSHSSGSSEDQGDVAQTRDPLLCHGSEVITSSSTDEFGLREAQFLTRWEDEFGPDVHFVYGDDMTDADVVIETVSVIGGDDGDNKKSGDEEGDEDEQDDESPDGAQALNPGRPLTAGKGKKGGAEFDPLSSTSRAARESGFVEQDDDSAHRPLRKRRESRYSRLSNERINTNENMTQSMKIPEFSGEIGAMDINTFLVKVDQAVSMLEKDDPEGIAAMVHTKLTKTALTWLRGELSMENPEIKVWPTLRPLLIKTFDRTSSILECLKMKQKLKMKQGSDPDHFFYECRTTMLQVCDIYKIEKKYIETQQGHCGNCKRLFDTGLTELYWNGLEPRIRDKIEARPNVNTIEEIREHAMAAHRAFYRETKTVSDVSTGSGESVDAVGKGKKGQKGKGGGGNRLGRKADSNGEFICYGCWHRTKTHNKSSCPHPRAKPLEFNPDQATRCTVAPKAVESVEEEKDGAKAGPSTSKAPEASQMDTLENTMREMKETVVAMNQAIQRAMQGN